MYETICSVGERGQITLPKEIRKSEGIKSKDKVIVKLEDDKIIIEKKMDTKEREALIKEYYQKYSKRDLKIADEWECASKEADEMLDEY